MVAALYVPGRRPLPVNIAPEDGLMNRNER